MVRFYSFLRKKEQKKKTQTKTKQTVKKEMEVRGRRGEKGMEKGRRGKGRRWEGGEEGIYAPSVQKENIPHGNRD